MNKKGFVLMETIVVIVVVSVALLTIFSSYNKILSKLRTENKYDTSEYIYITKYIKNYLQGKVTNITDICNISNDKCEIFTNHELSQQLDNKQKEIYNVEKIYLLTNLNNFDKEMTNNEKNSLLFDAYMIDYIKKLNVKDVDKLLIVEYKRPVKDTNNNVVRDTLGNTLYETYISSLEWD